MGLLGLDFVFRHFGISSFFFPIVRNTQFAFNQRISLIDKYYVKVPKTGIICLISTVTNLITIAFASKLSPALVKVELNPRLLETFSPARPLPAKLWRCNSKQKRASKVHLVWNNALPLKLACSKVSCCPSANKISRGKHVINLIIFNNP